ncbi:hypothetical protein BC827DRAFT_1153678 [Russula dissimulans]|nr:hypothetical protein BC827DRAFT_1153678 [Russula dissimulans]
MTTSKPDALEQIFLKLEEESERRALEAEDTALSPDIPDLAVAAQRATRQMRRHRGSVSISRFGHPLARSKLTPNAPARLKMEEPTRQANFGPPQMPQGFVHGMATLSPFYAVQSYNHSVDSLSDQSSFDDDGGRSADSQHVTQVHRIAGRQSLPRSVGEMLQRTLTRSRSKNELSSNGTNTNVVIGVVVEEEDHVEEAHRPETPPRPASRVMVHAQAPATLRSQPSRMTIPGARARDTNGGWRSKAGELFKRKARPRGGSLWA